ncbi:hypothetical protein [Paenibacillus campinasensis]|uniref:Uncharacterized protein n=1 Tax=Paenibacillus campinasensis TaxID=66347 RepID=A0A268EI79_9BACL|nr:hypothetical protein [Paenibacillus campinasensis]PAD72825.1 hypothetical protein CHH67_21185 [Paenibacillus campinasensis]
MPLKQQQFKRMCRFQEKHFTPEQIDEMGFEDDKEIPGVSYHWFFWVGEVRYEQRYDLKSKEITLKKAMPLPKRMSSSAGCRFI